MSRKRDSQKSKVYAAERAASRRFKEAGIETLQFEVGDIAAVDKYIHNLLGQMWVHNEWRGVGRRWARQIELGKTPRWVTVKKNRGSWAWANDSWTGWEIHLPMTNYGDPAPFLWNEQVVLHELAHTLVPHDSGHDRIFCRTYARLIKNRFGTEAEKILKEEFRKRGAKYSLPRKLTDEQKAAATARLAKARSAKKESVSV
jgi:putative metallohydrolase (TIGR04338 family)